MFNITEKHYIFKQSTEKVRNIYYDSKIGLCMCFLNKRNIWSEPEILQKNVHKSFCAEMDSNDIIHIFHQDLSGNLFYTRVADENKNTIQILSSKVSASYDKHLSLILSGNSVHFFYALKVGEATMLGHQIFSSEEISSPHAIDYVYPGDRPFISLCDNAGNVYVFYSSVENEKIFGYKKYTYLKKLWGEFTQAITFDTNIEYPSLLLDSNNIIHFTYQKVSGKQYTLHYCQSLLDKNAWSDEVQIHSSVYPFVNSSLLFTAESKIIYWVRDDVIYNSISYDHGHLWSKPSKYPFIAARQLICAVYKSNQSADYGKLTAREIPASYIEGYKLAFVNDTPVNRTPNTPEDLKNLIVDTLSYLKASIEDVKDSIAELNEKQIRFETTIRNYSVEHDKLVIRLENLENLLKNK